MGIRKVNGNYIIDFRCHGKRYREKIGPSKRQAELVLQKRKVSIAENRFLEVKKRSRVLFDIMSNDYIERYSKLNKESFKKDISTRNIMMKYFAGKYLSEITPLAIEDYRAWRIRGGVKKTTVNRDMALLKHIYTKAIEWGKAEENPVKRVKNFPENNDRVRFLEKGEIKALMDCCPYLLKQIVFVAIHTGMRQGNILSLTWDAIDFDRGIITLPTTKNKKGHHVSMNSMLIAMLENMKSKCNPDSPYVFENKGKRLSRYGIVRGTFNRVVRKAGIVDFHFHDLKHTFASLLAMAGVPISTIKELLGHKTEAMTRRYTHLSPEYKKSTVELLCNKVDNFWKPEEKAETTPTMMDHKISQATVR
ncbi:MAG TPA: hypothetical protein DEE98_04550 [Elusimicrobia bacterium]|nr:MAG: hypothetical protein A2278_04240 [Elusimicrobia bacterium RIFOXYA12_FULL_49_49]OGS09780.1 MAG: hypothetical protein A2204_01250 [Elusimicrobia bacterium RIFOXYA1_FULL_47_7]OGS10516.1 MAG: hypothetical protein A2386_05430 [Elusimicrobia bacterium RIFOXYB1_FULL_48_9]OGS14740.1 MAG: hypothetical protein A2251_09605 [Elusimicrobia bacterium RIFOXYA2_FULL_47_53]OGS25608.1 MAG: hypothetical protein A2339_05985 [Elusimicrobia bacterium RIFOXYB12_FULL_50_12]OGS31831.1 MAG: hypothetical protein